jgi:hypothetical protein
VVEYGGITASLAVLVVSLAAALGAAGSLPAIDAKALTLVSVTAKSKHVSGPEARAAYAGAPYRRPALRYLYATAWVSAASDRARCQAQLLLGPDPKRAAAAALRRSPKLLARLRTAHVTVSQAATALGRGTRDGCA